MFRNNTNIIGFLQRKQFFNRSPSPSPNSRFATNPPPPPHPAHSRPSKLLTPPKSPKNDSSKSNFKTVPVNRNIFELARENSLRAEGENSLRAEGENSLRGEGEARGQTRRSFESSRVEVKMCIEELAGRVSAELRQLEGAITELTVSLESIFYRKLGELRAELSRSMDEVFAQARNNLNHLLTASNEKHLKRLLKCRHHLADADKKVRDLKTTLDGNWRNAAAEMFATSFDQKLEQLLEESEQTRKGAEVTRGGVGVPTEEATAWEAISRSVQGLIERRCR